MAFHKGPFFPRMIPALDGTKFLSQRSAKATTATKAKSVRSQPKAVVR